MSKQQRILCWDNKAIAQQSGIQIRMHHPEKRNMALRCDDEWEGVHNGNACVIKVGNGYRMYYQAFNFRHMMDGTSSPGRSVICMAESRDGITFKKPNLGFYEYNGTKCNNIIFDPKSVEGKIEDNFAIFYDTNPDCPKDEQFKALVSTNTEDIQLLYFASEDGYHFRKMYPIPVQGILDSYNVTFWDEDTQQYFLYYRAFHSPEGVDKLTRADKPDSVKDIRDVRFATSKDFITWKIHGRIQFEEGQPDCPLYTNQIIKYYRDPSTYIGFPSRYLDRAADADNFKFMPLSDRHQKVTELFNREGTSVTDCIIMTSRDGFTFDRRDEAFITPGIENRYNWWYGNCFPAYGMVETEAEEAGAPNEISLYIDENYRIKNVNFNRYTIRLDGFFSWYAPHKGGQLLTTPITVTEDTMHVNFASSALGGMQIALCDEDGTPLEGYKSYTIFGNSVDRPVEFEKELSALKGQRVRLQITLQDTHLYSIMI